MRPSPGAETVKSKIASNISVACRPSELSAAEDGRSKTQWSNAAQTRRCSSILQWPDVSNRQHGLQFRKLAPVALTSEKLFRIARL
jgi:hypothetical protein